MPSEFEIQQERLTKAASAAKGLEFTEKTELPPANATFTISARGKNPDFPIFAFLRNQYGNIPLREIDSLFGFVEQCTLYGGRDFIQRELSDDDVIQLNRSGIGLRIPLSNHFVEREEYERYAPLLEKYHRQPNSIIVTNDTLAKWIRQDFPQYHIDASVIKNIKSYEKIDAALTLYDSVVLPMKINQEFEFLEKIVEKEKIILFANAGCAFTCPSKICYRSISTYNKGKGGDFECSQMYKGRSLRGMVDFDLQPYIDLGFHRFKMLRSRPGAITGF